MKPSDKVREKFLYYEKKLSGSREHRFNVAKEFTIDFFKNQELNKYNEWCIKYAQNLFLGFDTYFKKTDISQYNNSDGKCMHPFDEYGIG